MPEFDESNSAANGEDAPSKSERKREMLALQKLGQQLTELKAGQWQQFPLTDDVLKALAEFQRLTHRDARRRQLRYIGKLLRKVDANAVEEVYQRLSAPQRQETYVHHLCESWRERLIGGDNEEITAFIDAYPQLDRQEFRQLVNKAVKEQKENKPPRSSRALFQFIRRVIGEAES